MAVVVWHYLDAWKLSYLFPGPFAVTLFFELSGLLITWLLLKELDKTGTLDTRSFYLRRVLRLFPVFYTVWGLQRLLGPFAGSWAYFFYLGDYYTALTRHYGMLTQAWSLGVEEKFYLIWPFVLMRVERTKLMKALCVLLVLEPVYRLILSQLGFERYTWFAFDARLDPIVVGCLIALAVQRGWRAPKWLMYPVTPLFALVLIFLVQRFSDLVIYLLAVILAGVIARPAALLNNRAATYLGSISYSLYLIHPWARDIVWERLFGNVHFSSITLALTSQVAIAVLAATALHFGIERPFLRLKNRLA